MDQNQQRDEMLADHRRNETGMRDDSNLADIKAKAVTIWNQYKIPLIAVLLMLIIIIIISPYIKITIPGKYEMNCIVIDYTKCLNIHDTKKTCFETLDQSQTCKCDVALHLTNDMMGNVTLYYELTTYDQTEPNYSRSRDDEQLSGHISMNLSSECGEYVTGASGKPIAPCGLVADSMFSDSYELQFNEETLQVVTPTGLVNKTGFQNPPPDLKEVFQGFKKPISWVKDLWELDPTNPDNNGFQNEGFIAWMQTNLKSKPVWRLKREGRYKDGLPSGKYTLVIDYEYPLNRYNGSRMVSLCAEEDCILLNYTYCRNLDDYDHTCFETLLRENRGCRCQEYVDVAHNMTGNVILKYELPTYDQTSNATSRDEEQLSGKLSPTPSRSCEPYAYSDGTPIAPCGFVADSMFTDSYKLAINNMLLNYETTGLVDKTGFKNPPADLTKAFKDFDKPKSWVKNVWELDPENPDNNGFQNEAFIAWMRTDLKQKPVWRLKLTGRYKDGLPAGTYNLRISYEYPVSRYNGSRIIRVCGENNIPDTIDERPGLIALLVICVIIVIIIVSWVSFNYWKNSHHTPVPDTAS